MSLTASTAVNDIQVIASAPETRVERDVVADARLPSGRRVIDSRRMKLACVSRRLVAVAVVAGCLSACGGSTQTKTVSVTVTASASRSGSAPAASTAGATSPSGASTSPAAGGGGYEGQGAAARQYVASVAPANAALHAFGLWMARSPDTTESQAAAAARPTVLALGALRSKLLALARAYPPASADVRALLAAYGPLQGDLKDLGAVSQSTVSAWLTQFAHDLDQTRAAAMALRSVLGLPAPGAVPV